MFKPNLTRQKPGLLRLTQLARTLTGWIVFRKTLPKNFGHSSLYVTSHSNIRYLLPGFQYIANDLLTMAERYVRPGQVVWDLGSNLGVFAFAAAFKAGRSGAVYSLEANPKYTEIQNRSLPHLAAGSAPVSILPAAISDTLGMAELNILNRGEGRNFLTGVTSKYPERQILARKQVLTVTGDFLLDHWKSPDFVKIDVEGAELLALRGAGLLLTKVRPVFYIEVWQENQAEITRLLLENDYRLYELGEDGQEKPVEACRWNTLAKPAGI